LDRKQVEAATIAARLLTAQDDERRRIATELHDDLNQRLAMLEVSAEKLLQKVKPSTKVSADLESLGKHIGELTDAIRGIGYQLYPSNLDHLGLAVAARSYCTDFSKRMGIAVELSVSDRTETVARDAALCLYRVLQESLGNIAKHASATSAAVSLD